MDGIKEQLRNSYSTGNIIGTGTDTSTDTNNQDDIGGLVGYNIRTIKNSYATGDVSGDDGVGGLVGNNTKTITNSYSIGNVSGNINIGGLVGNNTSKNVPGTCTNSYWDTTTSRTMTSACGAGRTSDQLKQGTAR